MSLAPNLEGLVERERAAPEAVIELRGNDLQTLIELVKALEQISDSLREAFCRCRCRYQEPRSNDPERRNPAARDG